MSPERVSPGGWVEKRYANGNPVWLFRISLFRTAHRRFFPLPEIANNRIRISLNTKSSTFACSQPAHSSNPPPLCRTNWLNSNQNPGRIPLLSLTAIQDLPDVITNSLQFVLVLSSPQSITNTAGE